MSTDSTQLEVYRPKHVVRSNELQRCMDIASESGDTTAVTRVCSNSDMTVEFVRSPDHELGDTCFEKDFARSQKRKRRAERKYNRLYGDGVPNPLHVRPARKLRK